MKIQFSLPDLWSDRANTTRSEVACPVLNRYNGLTPDGQWAKGAAMREYPTIAAHSDYGAADCCGIIMPVHRGDMADLTCNECGAVVDTVDAGQADGVLLRMALSGGVCSETCPQCAVVNTFPALHRWRRTHAATAARVS